MGLIVTSQNMEIIWLTTIHVSSIKTLGYWQKISDVCVYTKMLFLTCWISVICRLLKNVFPMLVQSLFLLFLQTLMLLLTTTGYVTYSFNINSLDLFAFLSFPGVLSEINSSILWSSSWPYVHYSLSLSFFKILNCYVVYGTTCFLKLLHWSRIVSF